MANGPKTTGLGKLLTLVMIFGLVGLGAFLVFRGGSEEAKPVEPAVAVNEEAAAAPVEGLIEAETAVPRLEGAGTYTPVNNTVVVELSEYAGYAGLIVANGGLKPSEDSYFFTQHGFKVEIKLSEEESWSALNAGRIGVSATTVDVLAVYGKQLNVVVPAQIGFSRGADGLVVRQEIRRLNDLKGKVVLASQFTEAEFFLRYLAQEAGIPVKTVLDEAAPLDPEAILLRFAEDAFVAGDVFLADLQGAGSFAGVLTWEPKTSEVIEGSGGKARLLTSNKNLLVVADILLVNRGFAEASPAMVQGLVDGLLHGNRLVRDQQTAQLPVIASAFGWTPAEAQAELAKVHLSTLPESQAFFSGAIDMAGSFGGIYQLAVYAYGRELIRDAVDSARFLDGAALTALEAAGTYKEQQISIAPIRQAQGTVEQDPLLSKDIRFLFEPNSEKLDMQDPGNLERLADLKRLLQLSPGSTILLRGHVDDSLVAEFRAKGGEAFVRQMALKAVDLSRSRAVAVEGAVVEVHKVDEQRIETVGLGWDEPIGRDPEQNRRVEVQWFTVE